MIMSLTVLSSATSESAEFSYDDGDVFVKYKVNDELEGLINLCIR